MMKDVDGAYRHIDPLIHRYLVEATVMRSKDIMLRPFVYNVNVFSQWSNPRHFSQHDVSTAIETVSTIPTPSVFYHYLIRGFSPLQSIPAQTHISSLTWIVVPPNDVVWLSFDSVVHSLGSHFLSWPDINVKHYMLETSELHFRIASSFNSHSSIRFTTLYHIFHHLH